MNNKKEAGQGKKEKTATVREHIEEFRTRVIRCVMFWLLAVCIVIVKVRPIMRRWVHRAEKEGYVVFEISPQDLIVQELRLAGVLSLIVGIPFFLYQVASFVTQPANKKDSRKLARKTGAAMVLFLLGSFLGESVLIPYSLSFFRTVSSKESMVSSSVSIGNLMDLYFAGVLVAGAILEIPWLIGCGYRMGWLNAERMRKLRPYFVILSLIIGMLLTPPDVISQLFVAILLLLILEMSIVIGGRMNRRKMKGGEDSK